MSHQKLLGWGSVTLLAVMPFHAFLSVWAGHLFGHMELFQSWKELLIGLMGLVAIVYFYQNPKKFKDHFGPLWILIAAYAAVSLLVTAAFANGSRSAILRGAKTDLVFLLAFVLASLVTGKYFKRLGQKVLLASTAAVSLFAIAENFFLPANFLVRFGYGPSTVPPSLPYGNLHRFPSTLGGPNQLGAFLILPIALTMKLAYRQKKIWQFALLGAELLALFFTDSRSAWIGAATAIIIVLLIEVPRRYRVKIGVAILAVLLVGAWQISRSGSSLLIRSQGAKGGPDSQHLRAVIEGTKKVIKHPLGLGLGAAGPASFSSAHPIITENYYLQLALEVGMLGLILFLAINYVLGKQLLAWKDKPGLAGPLLAALIGVSIVNLFLHGWADSSTALTYWTLAGLTVGGAEVKSV